MHSELRLQCQPESCTSCAVYNRNMLCRKEQDLLVVFMCDINVGWSFGVDIVGMETYGTQVCH